MNRFKNRKIYSQKCKTFSEIKSDDDFRDYAHKVMKAAHGDNYSEEVTDKVVDDLLKNNKSSSYGELIGRLTSNFSKTSAFSSVDSLIDKSAKLKSRIDSLTSKIVKESDPDKKTIINNDINIAMQESKLNDLKIKAQRFKDSLKME